jgi:AcrR family transcriptional regulator
MGNREDLLAGARKAILERGVARATARDIAGNAGVSLAAIGYHFGSKDRLITEALTQAVGDAIGDGMEDVMRAAGAGAPLPEAFVSTWDTMLPVFVRNREDLLLSMENGVRIARSPQLQQFMTDAVGGAYDGIAEVLRELHPDLTAEQSRAVAKLYFVLVQGMALLWMLGPEMDLPTGADLSLAATVLARGSAPGAHNRIDNRDSR